MASHPATHLPSLAELASLSKLSTAAVKRHARELAAMQRLFAQLDCSAAQTDGPRPLEDRSLPDHSAEPPAAGLESLRTDARAEAAAPTAALLIGQAPKVVDGQAAVPTTVNPRDDRSCAG